jgi:hypothetical protein
MIYGTFWLLFQNIFVPLATWQSALLSYKFVTYFSPNLVTLSEGVDWNFRFSGQPLPVQARMALHFADFSPGCISQSLI